MDRFRVRPIDDELHALPEKRIMDIFELSLKREQSLFAGYIGQIDDRRNGSLVVMFGIRDAEFQQGSPFEHHRKGILNADGSDGSAYHDDEGGELHDRVEMAAFKDLPTEDRSEREHHADDCCNIQFGYIPLFGLFGLSGLSHQFGQSGLFGI